MWWERKTKAESLALEEEPGLAVEEAATEEEAAEPGVVAVESSSWAENISSVRMSSWASSFRVDNRPGERAINIW